MRCQSANSDLGGREYEPLIDIFVAKEGPVSRAVVTKARYDFSGELYASFSGAKGSAAIRSYCPPQATWGTILKAAIGHTSGDTASKDLWIGALSSAIQAQQIEYFPGSYRAKLSSQRVVKLKGTSSMAVLSQGVGGSLKRKAIDRKSVV